ncbi:MAG: hypothetical protein QOH96_1286 [Blastocatellia bacterium]|nr:hypothetical protein [Blastocatellia bacterium]
MSVNSPISFSEAPGIASDDHMVLIGDRVRVNAAPWILAIGVLMVYLIFPTKTYYWDGVNFALSVENSSGLSRSLIHPHHLLYNVFGYVIYHLCNAAGLNVRALQVLLVTNGVLSALCAGLFFRFLLQTFRSVYLSSVLTLLFAFSATWWKYSTDADSYVPSILLFVICLNLMVDGQKPRPFCVALVHAASMFMHQLAVFFYPVIVLGILLQSRELGFRQRAQLVLKYSVTACSITLAANYYCFHLQTGAFNLGAFAGWLTTYLHGPNSYSFSFDLWSNAVFTARGHTRLLFGGRLNWLRGLVTLPIVALIVILTGAILVLLVQFVKDVRSVASARIAPEISNLSLIRPRALCCLWVGVYLTFLFFWYPYFTPYRLFYLPALIVLFGIVLARYRKVRPPGREWYAALFATALALSNFLFFIYPLSHVEKNPPLALALALNSKWAPGTSIYYASSSADNELFRYFNPSTRWQKLSQVEDQVSESALKEIYRRNSAAWLETSAIEFLKSSTAGQSWLAVHTREGCKYELVNGSYNINYVQIFPSFEYDEGQARFCN